MINIPCKMTHSSNPNYSGDRDLEDHDFMPAQAKS
jgi:hypothetical protein